MSRTKGSTLSKEHRTKISAALRGRVWDRHQTAEARKKISDAAKKRWAKPGFRDRLSEVMSAGAKRRWADKTKRKALLKRRRDPEVIARNVAGVIASCAERAAASFGIPLSKWKKLTRQERANWFYDHPRVKALHPPGPQACKLAKLVGVTPEEYVLMSGAERSRLQYVKIFRPKHKAARIAAGLRVMK
jgi:hypothetical protein